MPIADSYDYDGFYGEPAEHDSTLEVELLLLATDVAAFDDDDEITAPVYVGPRPVASAVTLGDLEMDKLEDGWFASFDETAEFPVGEFVDAPTTRWGKIGDWLRSLGRAA